jgi:hypothetical protein
MRKQIELGLTVNIAIEDLAVELANCNRTQLLKLIKTINEYMADSVFTMLLYQYFDAVRKEDDAEDESTGGGNA